MKMFNTIWRTMRRNAGGKRSIIAGACALALGCTSLSPAWAAESAKDREAAEHERQLMEARRRLDEAAREVAELSWKISEDTMPRMGRLMGRQAPRAMLGVNIGAIRDAERQDGVEIISVSPGGPAAEAGLKAGDVLIEINGTSLKQEGDRSPREKLLDTMRKVAPEEKVNVRYLRDGKAASAAVVPRRADPMVTMPLRMRELEGLPALAFMRSHGAFGSAELVAMTPKLGQYFGTDKGLLVVRAPADTRLKLEEGDVLLDIDGRVPTSAAHAVRILGSYQAGETLKLNVMRMKKRIQLDIRIPEDVLERAAGPRVRLLESAPPAPPPPPPRGRDDA